MSNVLPFKTEEMRLEQASEWLARLDRGLTQDEEQQIRIWIAAHPENQATLMEVAQMWDKMGALEKLSSVFPHSPQASSSHKWANWIAVPALAACFALLMVIASPNWLEAMFSPQAGSQTIVSTNQYETKIGEQATFYLQDKTKVVLNTDSQVRITYTDKQRLFELLKGELHVTVAHNRAQPLSVVADGKVIQAVGTAFNVELKDNKVELLVTDGKVLVSDTQAQDDLLALTDVRLPASSLAVSKGQKVALNGGTRRVETVTGNDIEADLSWQQGNLVFRGESLSAAMREVSRYTSYRFELVDKELADIQVAGLFKTSDIEGLLAALEQNFDVRNQRVGSNVIRLRLGHTTI